MQLGGFQHKHERVFLLSLTHGAENHSIAAAIATLKFYQENSVIEKLYSQGERLTRGINKVVKELNLENYFGVIGRLCCMVYYTKDQNYNDSQPFRTLFLQETMKRGLLMPSLVVSYLHSNQDIDYTVEKTYEALEIYKKALNEGVEKYLVGRPVKPTFRKFG